MNSKFGPIEKNRVVLPTEARRRAQKVIGLQMHAYRAYLNDAFRVIEVAADNGDVFCDYTVPIAIPRVPILPYKNVIYHVIMQLTSIGYSVKFLNPHYINHIRISWYKSDIYAVGESLPPPLPTTETPTTAAANTFTQKKKPTKTKKSEPSYIYPYTNDSSTATSSATMQNTGIKTKKPKPKSYIRVSDVN